MAMYEYAGVVEMIGEVKEFSNNFTKRELVVGNDPDSPSRYPNPVLFSFKKEKCQLLDAVKVGDRVKVTFAIDGRKWDGPNGVKYFVDLTGLKLETVKDGVSVEPVPQPPEAPAVPDVNVDDEDLPF